MSCQHTISSVLLVIAISACSVLALDETAPVEEGVVDLPTIDVLDTNGDGILDPYESMDAILLMQDELDGASLTPETMSTLLDRWKKEEQAYVDRLFDDLDLNGDGRLAPLEMDAEMLEYLDVIDTDQDGFITPEELVEAEDLDPIFFEEEEILEEVKGLFRMFDDNGSNSIDSEEAGSEWPFFVEMDFNLDRLVTRTEVLRAYRADNQEAVIEVTGEIARIEGVLTSRFPADMLRMIFEHPEVRTLELSYISGSLDDEANMRACRYIRARGLDTHVPAGGMVASGGTDLFLSGRHRTRHDRSLIGVHSWSWMGNDGDQLPRDHEEHQLYIDFYQEIQIPEAFYWFTLQAAPADEVHWMTPTELEQYGCLKSPPADQR